MSREPIFRDPGTANRPKGPRARCPACGLGSVTDAVYCSPARRVRVGILRYCKDDGKHLHQACARCKFRWLCTPVEVPP